MQSQSFFSMPCLSYWRFCFKINMTWSRSFFNLSRIVLPFKVYAYPSRSVHRHIEWTWRRGPGRHLRLHRSVSSDRFGRQHGTAVQRRHATTHVQTGRPRGRDIKGKSKFVVFRMYPYDIFMLILSVLSQFECVPRFLAYY